MNKNPMDVDVFEILNDIVKIKTPEKQVEHIQQNYPNHAPLRYIVKMNYCDSITTLFPAGEPPFNKDESDGPYRKTLWTFYSDFVHFIAGNHSNMPMLKREKLFINMLQDLDPTEATMVCLAKDKKLETKYPIDISVWQAAYPDLAIQRA